MHTTYHLRKGTAITHTHCVFNLAKGASKEPGGKATVQNAPLHPAPGEITRMPPRAFSFLCHFLDALDEVSPVL